MARVRVEITEAQLRQIEVLAGYGLAEAAIAHAINVAPRTMRRRKVDDEAVTEAVARGKAKAQGLIGEALFKRAKDGDVPAIKWWEQTRLGYRDAQSHEVTGANGGAVRHEVSITRRIVRPGDTTDNG